MGDSGNPGGRDFFFFCLAELFFGIMEKASEW